jgi:hypothetical protein
LGIVDSHSEFHVCTQPQDPDFSRSQFHYAILLRHNRADDKHVDLASIDELPKKRAREFFRSDPSRPSYPFRRSESEFRKRIADVDEEIIGRAVHL